MKKLTVTFCGGSYLCRCFNTKPPIMMASMKLFILWQFLLENFLWKYLTGGVALFFSGTDATIGWDGFYNDVPAQEDVYP